ncbi:hypothetical protein FACS189413_01360 [Bacteroidia bacterium]|nr:hypothetical protein FACS189413_01360 [Bacteroidia bacterium]
MKKCKVCASRKGCYQAGAKNKTYHVAIKTDTQIEQLNFQQSDRFKEKYQERYKIEAKNAELKQVYGYDRAHSYGLAAMQMQGALTIFAANLKRILKLM